ncbi:hypothetical protein L3X38_014887 [Prunus dulcis]|uniref:Uncharacterized protein n=1 Tax=Prunus dulcis TaxID=3755 RepID=A0AAD4WPM8_PRUDU|nr:hypothetical protein L3X38_014887 [Prunus dulcis]
MASGTETSRRSRSLQHPERCCEEQVRLKIRNWNRRIRATASSFRLKVDFGCDIGAAWIGHWTFGWATIKI